MKSTRPTTPSSSPPQSPRQPPAMTSTSSQKMLLLPRAKASRVARPEARSESLAVNVFWTPAWGRRSIGVSTIAPRTSSYTPQRRGKRLALHAELEAVVLLVKHNRESLGDGVVVDARADDVISNASQPQRRRRGADTVIQDRNVAVDSPCQRSAQDEADAARPEGIRVADGHRDP